MKLERNNFSVGAGRAGLLSVLLVGCASPGPPRAPSLRLPQVASGVSAERRGAAVVVRFATPVRTTDNELVGEPVRGSLCRAVGDGPCQPTASFPRPVPITGLVEWVDALPPELASGVPRKLSYRVETFNARGRSAGPTDPVYAAAGVAPAAVRGLKADGSRRGIELHWSVEQGDSAEVLIRREARNTDGSPVDRQPTQKIGGTEAKVSRARKTRSVAVQVGAGPPDIDTADPITWLRADESASPGRDRGGMLDATAQPDRVYQYTAVRHRFVTMDGVKLELRSEEMPAVTTVMKDVYPPEVPQGLLAVGFPLQDGRGVAVDLVWTPVADSSLLGYNVYRAPQGGVATRLTQVALPAFHDVTAERGVGYRYTVTAIDRKGNESAASAAADVMATP